MAECIEEMNIKDFVEEANRRGGGVYRLGYSEDALYRTIQLLTIASDKVGNLMKSAGMSGAFNTAKNGIDSTHAPLPAVTNNQSEAIHFGDVNIYGANEDTVRQHQEINRRFTNEVLAQLRIKR